MGINLRFLEYGTGSQGVPNESPLVEILPHFFPVVQIPHFSVILNLLLMSNFCNCLAIIQVSFTITLKNAGLRSVIVISLGHYFRVIAFSKFLLL